MDFRYRSLRLVRGRRAFTRLEFGLLTAMLGAIVVNGIASLGGGLGSGHKPIGKPEIATPASEVGPTAPSPPAP